jgi:hypothetical protein
MLSPLAFWLTTLAMPLSAAETMKVQLHGRLASAYFTSIDPAGCLSTTLNIQVSDEAFHTAGAPQPNPELAVSVFQFDTCSGTQLTDASGLVAIPASSFQVDRQLNLARLDVTGVLITDYVSETVLNLEFHIDWRATGDVQRTHSHMSSQTPGFRDSFRMSGTGRPAEAVGAVLLSGTNLTSVPSDYASINLVKSSELEITHFRK